MSSQSGSAHNQNQPAQQAQPVPAASQNILNSARGLPTGQFGNTYKLYRANYGYQQNIVVKSALMENFDLCMRDIMLMQSLRPFKGFPVFFTVEQAPGSIYYFQEEYQQDCVTILSWYKFDSNAAGNPGLQMRVPGFCLRRFFREIWDAINFMHHRNIVHRNIRAKNIYIQQVNGKFNKRIHNKYVHNNFHFCRFFSSNCERP